MKMRRDEKEEKATESDSDFECVEYSDSISNVNMQIV